MAVLKESNWYMRAGGAETNGGGYDATNYPGGTNYADQDSPQLSLTDLVSTASTTVTSAAAGFTSDMVGNCLRIASGTGSPTTGYYFIVSYTNSSTVVLDRVSGTYTAGVAKVGGAHASLINYASGGDRTAPAIASPVIAGNTINIRGAGTDNPTTPDYDYSGSGTYWAIPQGDYSTGGFVKIIGYNGRPLIKTPGLIVYSGGGSGMYWLENLKFLMGGSIYGLPAWACRTAKNCYFDQNGYDLNMHISTNATECWFNNTGSTSSGSQPATSSSAYGGLWANNLFENLRGSAASLVYMTNFRDNIIVNCKSTTVASVVIAELGSAFYHLTVSGNVIYNGASHGISVSSSSGALFGARIFNNIIANNAGYGISFPSGTTYNDRNVTFCDYNCYYSNTSGALQNKTAGANDLTTNPTFTNTGSLDFSVGTNMKAEGYPGLITKTGTTSYVDIGAAQRQETGGGGGATGGSFPFVG